MVLPGGAAAKLGDHYEHSWTLLKLLDILEGSAKEILIEPVGKATFGVEFRLVLTDGTVQWHQAKRKVAADHWSVASLKRVLVDFGPLLRSGDMCVFVSRRSAGGLEDLSDRARSLNFDDFIADLTNSLNGSTTARSMYARGDFDAATNTITAYKIGILLLDPPM